MPAAQPDTSAGARTTAQAYFAFYSASQWNGVWQLLAPAVRAQVPEQTFVGVHKGCPTAATGLAYSVESADVTGKSAVATFTIPKLKAILGTEKLPMAWTPAGWGVSLSAASLAEYSHGSVAADVKALQCSTSKSTS